MQAALAGNLCRCGSHARVVKAVMAASGQRAEHECSALILASRLPRGGALAVAFSFAPVRGRAAALAPARPVNASDASSYLAIAPDGSVTLYCGKVDLGQGLRIAMRQIAAEELGIGVDRIAVEGDTALTPDQGRTSGSNGIQRGGMQVRRRAAATCAPRSSTEPRAS